jgi:hypothetical protein
MVAEGSQAENQVLRSDIASAHDPVHFTLQAEGKLLVYTELHVERCGDVELVE